MHAVRMRAAVVTVSDKGHAGERVDESGPALMQLLADMGAEVSGTRIVPDEQDMIEDLLCSLADGGEVDLILTSGGRAWVRVTVLQRQRGLSWNAQLPVFLRRCVRPRWRSLPTPC